MKTRTLRKGSSARRIGVSGFFAFVMTLLQASGQLIIVPQPAPYTNDPNSVLLEHFDGTNSGSNPSHWTLTYTNGVFGQAAHYTAGIWTYWNLPGFVNATVEFWGNLHRLNPPGMDNTFIRADLSESSVHTTFYTYVRSNLASSSYQCDCLDSNVFIGMGRRELATDVYIDTNTWHHYATTWGDQGFHFYVDGKLVYSNASTQAQGAKTAWWSVGAGPAGIESLFSLIDGSIDELRISNIQRIFMPRPALAVEALDPNAFRLRWFAEPATQYEVQCSSDLETWSSAGLVLGCGSETNVINATHGTHRFYRLRIGP